MSRASECIHAWVGVSHAGDVKGGLAGQLRHAWKVLVLLGFKT